jgi:peptidoglycan hydrolase-like protein with peptidoglycan-binding domain
MKILTKARTNFLALSLLAIAATTSAILGTGTRPVMAKQATPMSKAAIAPATVSKQSATTQNPILKIGSRGTSVDKLQAALKKAGFYQGSVDGIFGRQTQAAVLKFQQSKRLSTDGIVGSQTWSALAV